MIENGYDILQVLKMGKNRNQLMLKHIKHMCHSWNEHELIKWGGGR